MNLEKFTNEELKAIFSYLEYFTYYLDVMVSNSDGNRHIAYKNVRNVVNDDKTRIVKEFNRRVEPQKGAQE